MYCAFLGWQPNEFSISLFQKHCSKTNIDESRKLHKSTSKKSFFSILQTGSVIVWLPSATVNALNTWTEFNCKKLRQKCRLSWIYVFRSNLSDWKTRIKFEMVNNLQVAHCVGTVCVIPHPVIQLSAALLQPHIPSHKSLHSHEQKKCIKLLDLLYILSF